MAKSIEISQSFDVIECLLQRDLTEICFQIFSELDSESFSNCKLICTTWNNFIRHHFYELLRGKLWLKEKLCSNFLNPEFNSRLSMIKINEDFCGGFMNYLKPLF